jgi:hypothetical protein
VILNRLLFVTIFAGSRTFFTFRVTALTGFVSKILTESLNLAASSTCVTLGTVFQHFLVGLVVELDAFLQVDDVSSEGGTGKCGQCKQSDNSFFHFVLLFLNFCPKVRIVKLIMAFVLNYTHPVPNGPNLQPVNIQTLFY